jgi:dTDP-glucose 4,6-dehydratase
MQLHKDRGMTTLLVTGAAGFIGSAFCRYALRQNDVKIIGVDKMTYAASPRTLAYLQKLPGFSFQQMDICDHAIMHLIEVAQPDAIIHLAAETHVDRSIDSSGAFIQTNIVGTYVLLEAARVYWKYKRKQQDTPFRFINVSTDEVYGSQAEGTFHENTPYAPNSPYSASKASADHLTRAWYQTYGMPTIICNCSNNYGPYQFPEKLIPNIITKALRGEKLPVYGTGDNIRDWLHVDDHASGLWQVMQRGEAGAKYLFGGNNELNNLALVKTLCQILDSKLPQSSHRPHEQLINYVADRPGHDKRYAIDISQTIKNLGWQPTISLRQGLEATVDWYLANRVWWEEIHANNYGGERLGQPQQHSGALF